MPKPGSGTFSPLFISRNEHFGTSYAGSLYMRRMIIDRNVIRTNDVFDIIIENFPDIIHSVDDDGNIVFTNRAAEQLLGYSREELLAMNVRELYAREVLDSLERGFTNLKRRGDFTVESVLVAKDGSHILVEIRSFSIYDDYGRFVRTFSILRDVRKLKSLQEGIVHTERLAAIGELTSGIAHDINNPLALIRCCCDMINDIFNDKRDSPNGRLNEMEEYVADIDRASKSIEKLSRQMLDFSRGVSESAALVDLGGVVLDGLFLMNSKVTRCLVTVHHDIQPGNFFVKGVDNKLQQIFANLIRNASDAMVEVDTREMTITIVEDMYKEQKCWRCDVTDTGIGIPREKHKILFDSFFTTKPKGEGTGLGLSISRGIARDHKGDILVSSHVGKGTTFSVYLPILNVDSLDDVSGTIIA
jgi:PAS domain S-box-containing protein